MDETGSTSELERRLRAKAEEDRRRSEQIYRAELKTLGENLRRRALEEASSIGSAMESLTRPVAGTLRRLTVLFVALGVLLSLGTCGANLALVEWQSSEVESLREERARLEGEIADLRRVLDLLNEKRWGVYLTEAAGTRYIVLPKGTLANPPHLLDGFPVVPLPTE